MNIYFIRTSVWVLNRSFRHKDDAKLYIKQLKKRVSNFNKLDLKLLLNGVIQ